MQKRTHNTPIINRRQALLASLMICASASFAFASSNNGDTMPEDVVSELMSAMRANDATRIRAVFADTASQAYGAGSPKSGEAFRAWLQSDIIDRHGQVENPQLTIDGNEVVVTGEYRNNRNYRSAADFLFRVDGGKIVSWQMRY